MAKRLLLRSVVVVSVADTRVPTRRILEFATPVHRRYWFREAYPSVITPEMFEERVNQDIDTWLRFVLQTFRPSVMANPSSHGAGRHPLPLEWVFQHEFWRGASMMLPPEMRVAAELSKVMDWATKAQTRLDFWINSSLNWAVEVVRSTGKTELLDDHLRRFQENGSYFAVAPDSMASHRLSLL